MSFYFKTKDFTYWLISGQRDHSILDRSVSVTANWYEKGQHINYIDNDEVTMIHSSL